MDIFKATVPAGLSHLSAIPGQLLRIKVKEANLTFQSDWGYVAFDYNRCGRLDHVLAFRVDMTPDKPFAYRILRWDVDSETREPFLQGRRPLPLVPAGCEFLEGGDKLGAIAFDWESSGFMDHLMFHVVGQGIAIVRRSSDNEGLETVFASNGPVGDLAFSSSFAFLAVETDNYGKKDALLRYGRKWPLEDGFIFQIFRHGRDGDAHTFENVFTMPNYSFGLKPDGTVYWYLPCPVTNPTTGTGIILVVHGGPGALTYWSVLEWNRLEQNFELTEGGSFPPDVTWHSSDSSIRPLDYSGSGTEDHVLYLHMSGFGSPHILGAYRLLPGSTYQEAVVSAETPQIPVTPVRPVKPGKQIPDTPVSKATGA